MLAKCWEKVGENRDKFYLSPTICQHVVVSLTHANLSLPTRVANVSLTCEGRFKRHRNSEMSNAAGYNKLVRFGHLVSCC